LQREARKRAGKVEAAFARVDIARGGVDAEDQGGDEHRSGEAEQKEARVVGIKGTGAGAMPEDTEIFG